MKGGEGGWNVNFVLDENGYNIILQRGGNRNWNLDLKILLYCKESQVSSEGWDFKKVMLW